MEGKLKNWNEEKGFGFISLKNEPKDIFIHISALKKMARRPNIGDIITFEIHIDNNGKKRATNAQIKGVALIANKGSKLRNKTKNNNKVVSKLALVFLLPIVGYGIYFSVMQSKNPLVIEQEQTIIAPVKQKEKMYKTNFSCLGKEYCSQMESCEEAIFYLNNCNDTKIDGNNDGVPCESQWCN